MSTGSRPPHREKRWLDAMLEAYSSFPRADADQRRIAWAASLLLSNNPNANEVCRWLRKQHSDGPHPLGTLKPANYSGSVPLPCDRWEAGLFHLARCFAWASRLSAWEKADKDTRRKHASRVARHARLLADALEEPTGPDYPPVLALFDEADILEMADQMPGQRDFIAGNGWPAQPAPLDTPASRFGYFFPGMHESHQLPDVLRRLADWADASVDSASPVTRFATGNPRARVVAVNLSDYLSRVYGAPCDKIVANCISLWYPELDEVTEETIRKWTKRK